MGASAGKQVIQRALLSLELVGVIELTGALTRQLGDWTSTRDHVRRIEVIHRAKRVRAIDKDRFALCGFDE